MTRRASMRLRAVAPTLGEPQTPVTVADAASPVAVAELPQLAVASEPAAPSIDLRQLSISTRGPLALAARELLRRRLLAAADLVAMTVTLLAVVHRFGFGVAGLTGLAAMPAALVLFTLAGLYNRDELRLRHSTLDEVPVVLQVTAFFALGVVIVCSILSTRRFSAREMTELWLAAFLAVLSGRVAARVVACRLTPVERCLIVGDRRRADRIRARIASSQARAAVVDCVTIEDLKTADGFWAVVGIVGEQQIDRIILAPGGAPADEAAELIRIAKGTGVRLSVVPDALEAVGSAVAFDELEGMVLLGLPRFGLRTSARSAKRVFDIVASAIGLVLLGPLLVFIAVAVRVDSRGSIFFRQTRIGRHGRSFAIVKFRSMGTDAELRKEHLRALSVAGQGLFKLVDDPRVTRVGHFLRTTSLDELPQLFNVLRGDMTLVGPRPLVPDEDAQICGLDRSRLLLTPGLTGPWQLMGTRVPLEEMVEIDYLYASSWSLWLDVKILLRTVRHVMRRANL
jgi:exopolysaccharide biosynthesis polyprenyl glycosylphosphotransferase